MQQDAFEVGQCLTFSTSSPLYPDVYQAEIKAVYPDRLDLKLSLHNGYLMLVPVGTKIHWFLSERRSMVSQVIDRKTSQKMWSVTLPKTEYSLRGARVLAVGSGKGGVGKTTFCINLSLALSQFQQRVVLLDADIGMANVEVLLGLYSDYNIADVIDGKCTLPEILKKGPGGINVLPGFSGIASLTELNALQFNRIIAGLDKLEDICDILILDTGAGMSEPVLKFLEAVDEIILLTNPEPHTLMDGYALLKVLSRRNHNLNVNFIINSCESANEARQCADKFKHAARDFLGIEPLWLDWLPETPLVGRSIKKKSPIIESSPGAEYSRRVKNIAKRLIGIEDKTKKKKSSGLKEFLKRLK
ncbi:MAG: AAA family ATPase [Clostridiales bacterium]|nr:AAA family ATPase [Clostridiales bacterium]MCF8022070.1 AAA family ATPase [Clostridiales bacterium]